MIFITYERSMMTRLAYLHDCHSCCNECNIVQKKKKQKKRRSMMTHACRAISAHNGGGVVSTRLQREERLFTNRSNRPGDDMKDELRVIVILLHGTWSTSQNYVSQLHP